jgi:hypothetical protein
LLALVGAGAQNLLDLAGDAAQLLDERHRLGLVEVAAELAELERQQKQRGELRGEGLGGGDADLRAGVGVDGAVGLAGHHGVHHVADGHGLGAEAFISRCAARVSAVSPDWVMSRPSASGSAMGLR